LVDMLGVGLDRDVAPGAVAAGSNLVALGLTGHSHQPEGARFVWQDRLTATIAVVHEALAAAIRGHSSRDARAIVVLPLTGRARHVWR
jgi:hypothetical protein